MKIPNFLNSMERYIDNLFFTTSIVPVKMIGLFKSESVFLTRISVESVCHVLGQSVTS